jgi:hypothetical protein
MATYFFTTLGAVASIITIKDDLIRRQKEEEWKAEVAKAKEETRKLTSEKTSNNFYNRLHVDTIDRSFKE